MSEDQTPNLLVGVDGCDLRISMTFQNEGEARAAAEFIREQINTKGSCSILLGTPGDILGTMQ